jgi:Ca2+-binding EF-hand superfamily protein
MLKMMNTNKMASLIVLSAVSIMIIISFVFWGIGPKDKQQEAVVAQINNDKIYVQEFWRAYDNEYKRITEKGAKKEDIEKLNLKDRVLDSLVDRAVLLIAAKDGGISVSENELQDAIKHLDYFQNNGVFDREIYMRRLSLNHMTPQSFENMLREDLITNKMTRLIGETTELSADEKNIISSLSGGNQGQLVEVFRANKINLAVKAYVDALKKQLDIKTNRDLIS